MTDKKKRRPRASPSGVVPAMGGPETPMDRIAVADEMMREAHRIHALAVGAEVNKLHHENIDLRQIIGQALVSLTSGNIAQELVDRMRAVCIMPMRPRGYADVLAERAATEKQP